MILLDTHIWIWLADESDQLTEQHRQVIEYHRADGLGVSAISCWEVAKLNPVNPIKKSLKLRQDLRDLQDNIF